MVTATLSASGTVTLGDVSRSNIGSWVVQVIINSGSFSAVTKGIIAGSGLASADRQNIGYRTAVSTTIVNPGVTPITAAGVYIIPADGMEVFLDATIAGGSSTIYASPLHG